MFVDRGHVLRLLLKSGQGYRPDGRTYIYILYTRLEEEKCLIPRTDEKKKTVFVPESRWEGECLLQRVCGKGSAYYRESVGRGGLAAESLCERECLVQRIAGEGSGLVQSRWGLGLFSGLDNEYWAERARYPMLQI